MRSAREHQTSKPRLKRALAVLLSSTRTKMRPLPLTEVAAWLRVAVSGLGDYRAVSDRLGISTKMLRQFSCVDRLAPEVRELFSLRQLDSVDAAAHLGMLPPRDQILVAKELAAGRIDTSDIRALVQLRKFGASKSVQALLDRVREGKTKRHFVAEFVVRGSATKDQISDAICRFVEPMEVVELKVDGVLGKLVLTQSGKKQLSRAARELNVTIKQVISRILSDLF